MVWVGGWQKVLENSIKDKVLRPGKHSLGKREFGVISTPKANSGRQLLNLSSFDKIPSVVLGN